MGFFDKLFGADEDDKPKEKADGGKATRAGAEPTEKADPVPVAPSGHPPAEPDSAFVVGVPDPKQLQAAVKLVARHVERTAAGFEQVLDGIKTLTGMLQAVAKSAARSDQELRAHITTETERLIGSMHEEARREASVDVFRAVLPALDEVDHVLRENEAGAEVKAESVRIVRRRLRDALSRLGIEEIPIAQRETVFDAQVHEGRPHEGDPDAVAGLPAHVVVDVERNGWTGFGQVLRHALVIVVRE